LVKDKKKLTFFLPDLSAGGAERVLLAISGEIAARGHRCDLVTAQSGGPWQHAVPTGVRHVSLESTKPLHSVLKLARYLNKERPMAILSSVFSANFAALLACHLSTSKTRCIVREAYRAGEEIKAPSTVTTYANKVALRVLYHRADAVVALSSELAAHIGDMAHVPGNRIHVIPNPLLPSTKTLTSKIRTPRLDGVPIVLACGRLELQKDFATLLQAFALVRAHKPSQLVILGSGSQLGSLKLLSARLGIEDDVHFAGHASNPHEWMRHAEVFVSTSRCEGFPNVLLEALDSGCQIVSTNSSDTVAEILDGGRLGTIVPVGDALAIAQSVVEILDGIRKRPSATEHLRSYDLSTITDRYLDVLLGN